MALKAQVIVPAFGVSQSCGRVLRITEPISFWGGVDPRDGTLSDPRSKQFGATLAGRVVMITDLRGSSSASSILLELIYMRRAPAVLIVDKIDAILAVGALVARAMEWDSPVILALDRASQEQVPDGSWVCVTACGSITFAEEPG